MTEEVSENQDSDHVAHNREILKAALTTMTVDQLQNLRATIIRLKHLPFTKLVEVLFTSQDQPDEKVVTTPDRVYQDDQAFVSDFHGHCESPSVRTLFEDVETALKTREGTTRK